MKTLRQITPRDWIGLALTLAGLVLRLRQYLINRSLWLDEAMLANNIVNRSFAGLFQPLDNNQGAPVGFLLLQKTVTLALGDSEYALRLLPFLAGILSLALMFALTRKVAGAFAGNLALALFAFSPALIYYTSEVKQYSSDVAIALALCLLCLKYAQDNDWLALYSQREFREFANSANGSGKNSRHIVPVGYSYIRGIRIKTWLRNTALLVFAGALAVWFSHPALFVLGGLGLAIFLPAVRAKDARKIVTLLLVAAAWSLSLGALYFVNLRPLASHQFFLDFWREGFLPHDLSAWRWLGLSLHAPFGDLLGLRTPYLVTAFLFLIGLVGLTRRFPRFGLFLLLVFFLTLLASFLTLYPFAGRMILFLAPALTLLLADGADLVADLTGGALSLSKRFIGSLIGKASRHGAGVGKQEPLRKPVRSHPSRWLAWTVRVLLAGYLLFSPLSLAAENFAAPKLREHLRPTLETLRDFRKDGDLVYVYYWAGHAVRFYAPKYGFAMSDFILGADHHDQPELYRAELDALRGHARVWFLFSHVYENGGFNEREFILDYLDSIGDLSRAYNAHGTSVFLYLYDLR